MSKRSVASLALALFIVSAPGFAAGREAPSRDPGRVRSSIGRIVKAIQKIVIGVLSYEPTVPIP